MKRTKRHRPSVLGTLIGTGSVIVVSLAALWRVEQFNQQARDLQASARAAERRAIAAEQAHSRSVAKVQHMEKIAMSERQQREKLERELAEARKQKPAELPATPGNSPQQPAPAVAADNVKAPMPPAGAEPPEAPQSAAVPLDFETSSTRVIARNVRQDGVLVDVSSDLASRQLRDSQPGEHRLILDRLKPPAAVFVELEIDRKTSAVVVELRPVAVLPSGKRLSLTSLHATQRARQLAESLSEAEGAVEQLPAMKATFRGLTNEARDLRQWLARGGGPTTAAGYARQAANRQQKIERLAIVNRQLSIGQKTIARAEGMASARKTIQSDGEALASLSDWIGYILADKPAIKIRIHSDGATLPAVVR